MDQTTSTMAATIIMAITVGPEMGVRYEPLLPAPYHRDGFLFIVKSLSGSILEETGMGVNV